MDCGGDCGRVFISDGDELLSLGEQYFAVNATTAAHAEQPITEYGVTHIFFNDR